MLVVCISPSKYVFILCESLGSFLVTCFCSFSAKKRSSFQEVPCFTVNCFANGQPAVKTIRNWIYYNQTYISL